MSGKLIVFEGTDGSGKSTQFKRLCRRLEEEGRGFHRLVFPRYDNPSSTLLRMYLQGEFGSHPDDVNAYAASTFYAVDRYASWKQEWEGEYGRGGLFLSDRYTTSNAVHQACKLPQEQWPEFLAWLFDLEYGKLGLPAPDLVVYLDMPTERAVEMLRSREAATHTKGDIHEVDTAYLAKCRAAAHAAAAMQGWHVVPCVDGAGEVRSIEEIHAQIWAVVEEALEQRI